MFPACREPVKAAVESEVDHIPAVSRDGNAMD